ncbi:MAG: DUF1844 domain-containing protein [Desulfobacterales bacterium]|nr:MAG: DUF1844 domain-containing protein [Desulfobacterales bacterium]
MSEEKKDFIVKDRRIFSQDAEQKQDVDEKPETDAAQAADRESARRVSQEQPTGEKHEEELQLPEINFPTFVASLNASALVHLGVIDDPATGMKSKNLPMAKQTIDILSLLQQKTEGNLTKEETDMLKNILYDLRITYVKEKE